MSKLSKIKEKSEVSQKTKSNTFAKKQQNKKISFWRYYKNV